MKSGAKLHKKQLFSTIAGLVALLLTSTSLCAAEQPGMTEEQKTFYAIGFSVARSLSVFDLTCGVRVCQAGLNGCPSREKERIR